jgi:hypothetical protein
MLAVCPPPRAQTCSRREDVTSHGGAMRLVSQVPLLARRRKIMGRTTIAGCMIAQTDPDSS